MPASCLVLTPPFIVCGSGYHGFTHTHVPTLTLRHRNKHMVFKNSCDASFFPPIIPLGVSSLAEWLNRHRTSLQGHQTINMKPSLRCSLRTVAVGPLWDKAAAWLVIYSAASSPCLSSLWLWLVAIAAVAWQSAQAFFSLWAYWPCLLQLLRTLCLIKWCVCWWVCVCLYTKWYLCSVRVSFSVTASIADQIIIYFNLTVSEALSDISQD